MEPKDCNLVRVVVRRMDRGLLRSGSGLDVTDDDDAVIPCVIHRVADKGEEDFQAWVVVDESVESIRQRLQQFFRDNDQRQSRSE